jgi:CubicO group peptidase (beta-lactamase class C family)
VLQHGVSPDGQRFMADATLNEMWADQLDSKLLPIGVGFNLMMGYSWNLAGRLMINTEEAQFKTVHGEGGWSGAASTYFWIDKANDISGIAMTQYLGSTTPLGLSMMSAAYEMFE